MTNPVLKAIKELGSQMAVANACGVSQNAISKWLNGSSKVSLENALKIEKATKQKVKAEEFSSEYAYLLSRNNLPQGKRNGTQRINTRCNEDCRLNPKSIGKS